MLYMQKNSQQIVNSLTFELGNDVYKIEWLKNYIHQRFVLKKNGVPRYTLSGFIRFGSRTIKDEKEKHTIATVESKSDGHVAFHWNSNLYYWSIKSPNISTLRKDSPDGPLIMSWKYVTARLEFATEFKNHSSILEIALLSLFCGAQRLDADAFDRENPTFPGMFVDVCITAACIAALRC